MPPLILSVMLPGTDRAAPTGWEVINIQLSSVSGLSMVMRRKRQLGVMLAGHTVVQVWLAYIANLCIISLDFLVHLGAISDVPKAALHIRTDMVALYHISGSRQQRWRK